MNVIVADDEYYARKALIKMIKDWGQDNIENIWDFENGQDVVNFMEKGNIPDVIFTDIKMPVLDGLGLLEYINKKKLDVHTFIISGYSEFSYAQMGIKYGCKDYILKPIDKIELNKTLDEVYGKIKYKSFEHKFNSLVYESDPKYSSDVDKILLKSKYSICIIKHFYKNEDILKFWNEAVKNKNMFSSYLFNSSNENELIFLNANDTLSKDDFLKYQVKAGDYFIKQIKKELKLSAFISISDVYEKSENIKKAYLESKMLMNYRFINEKGIYTPAYFNDYSGYDNEILSKIKLSFYNYILNGNSYDAVKLLDECLKNIQSAKISVCFLNDFISCVISTINCAVDYLNDDENKKDKVKYISPIDLNLYSNFDSLKAAISSYVYSICHEFENKKNKIDIIKATEDYIMNNYCYDIKLEDIAKNFFIDVSYLSKMFKNQVGCNFSEFLQNVRLSKAKEMLEKNEDCNITEIANAVGYNDSSYFISSFKKVYGMTPKKYKCNMMECSKDEKI